MELLGDIAVNLLHRSMRMMLAGDDASRNSCTDQNNVICHNRNSSYEAG